MIDGRIVRGPRSETPELGHVRLAPDGPAMFGKAGCVESFCSGEGISKLAPFMFPARFDGPVGADRLNRQAAHGDRAARAVLAEAARRTGQAAAILADLFCPQVIVLGTLARHFGSGWLRQVRGAFAREALPINARGTKIVPAGLGKKLQDLSPIAACVYRAGIVPG
jgi:glucokinase